MKATYKIGGKSPFPEIKSFLSYAIQRNEQNIKLAQANKVVDLTVRKHTV